MRNIVLDLLMLALCLILYLCMRWSGVDNTVTLSLILASVFMWIGCLGSDVSSYVKQRKLNKNGGNNNGKDMES